MFAFLFGLVGVAAGQNSEDANASPAPSDSPKAAEDDETPETPEEAFARALASDSSFQWPTAIAKELERDVEAEPRPPWVAATLRRFLTPPESLANPDRTAFLWNADAKANPLWVAPDLRSDVAFALLSDPELDPATQANALGLLAHLSSQPALHAAFVKTLRETSSPWLFRRVFATLADYDPNLLVGLAVERLANPGELPPDGARLALSEYLAPLGLTLNTADEWKRFWEQNRHQPIARKLIKAVADSQRQQRLAMWRRAADQMENTTALRDWLIAGLQRDQLLVIRVDAIRRIRDYALKRYSVASTDAKARRDELEPLFVQAVELAKAPSVSWNLRELAIEAISEMPDFKGEPRVLELLRAAIAGIENTDSEAPAYQLGVAAIRGVGELGADLGPELDAVLDREMAKSSEGWGNVDRQIVVAVLEAFKNTKLEPESLPKLRTVFEAADDAETKDLVLQVFRSIDLASFTKDAKYEILEFYRYLVEIDRAGPFVGKAIAGIDYLRLEDGVKILRDLAGDGQVSEPDRIRAVQSIRAIGGSEALDALCQLIESGAGPIRARALELAIQVCTVEQATDLVFLQRLLLSDPTSEPPAANPWLMEAIASSAVATLLSREPGFWVFEGDTPPPPTFVRWWRIEWAVLVDLEARAMSRTDLDEERQAYARLYQRASNDLQAVKGDVTGFPIAAFSRAQVVGKHRAAALAGLIAGDFAACGAAMKELATSDVDFDSNAAWLLSRLDAMQVREGEKALFDTLDTIAREKGLALADATKIRLTEARTKRKIQPSKDPDNGGRSAESGGGDSYRSHGSPVRSG